MADKKKDSKYVSSIDLPDRPAALPKKPVTTPKKDKKK
jgi:hypothetical protein